MISRGEDSLISPAPFSFSFSQRKKRILVLDARDQARSMLVRKVAPSLPNSPRSTPKRSVFHSQSVSRGRATDCSLNQSTMRTLRKKLREGRPGTAIWRSSSDNNSMKRATKPLRDNQSRHKWIPSGSPNDKMQARGMLFRRIRIWVKDDLLDTVVQHA